MKFLIFPSLLLTLLFLQNCSTDKEEELIEAVVSDPTGLSIFDETSYQSRKIIKIAYQEKITLLEDTQKSDEVNGVKGSWFKIKYKNMEGFAFSGFFEISGGGVNASNRVDSLPQRKESKPLIEKIRGKSFIYNNNSVDCEIAPSGGLGFIIFNENGMYDNYYGNEFGHEYLKVGNYEIKDNLVILFLGRDVVNNFSSVESSNKPLRYEAGICKERLVLENINSKGFQGMLLEEKDRSKYFVETVRSIKQKANRSPPSNDEREEIEYAITENTYVSNDEGIEEKLYVNENRGGYKIRYKSPEYKKAIYLNVYNSNTSNGTCEVSFPKAPRVRYAMRFKGYSATCTYPNGKVQYFKGE